MAINFCFYCERTFSRLSLGEFADPDTGLVVKTVDHIIPTSKGGKDVKLNKVYACQECNQKKNDLFLEQFLLKIDLELSAFLPTSRNGVAVRLRLIRKNILRLIDIIKPHLQDICWEGCQIQRSNVSAPDDWPEIEVPQSFDWSLSLDEINRRYLPGAAQKSKPVKKIYKDIAWPEEPAAVIHKIKAPSNDMVQTKFQKKYPYIFEILSNANPDLPRWLIDNIGSDKLIK